MTKKHRVLRQLDSVTDMAAECINYFVYHPSKDFTRKRKLDAKTFTLAMQGNCLNKELADAFPKPSTRMTASAYEQQKSKVNPRLFKAILYEFNSNLKQPALYHGYRLLAIDGSDFALPYDKKRHPPNLKCPTIVRHRHLTIVGYFYDQIFIRTKNTSCF